MDKQNPKKLCESTPEELSTRMQIILADADNEASRLLEVRTKQLGLELSLKEGDKAMILDHIRKAREEAQEKYLSFFPDYDMGQQEDQGSMVFILEHFEKVPGFYFCDDDNSDEWPELRRKHHEDQRAGKVGTIHCREGEIPKDERISIILGTKLYYFKLNDWLKKKTDELANESENHSKSGRKKKPADPILELKDFFKVDDWKKRFIDPLVQIGYLDQSSNFIAGKGRGASLAYYFKEISKRTDIGTSMSNDKLVQYMQKWLPGFDLKNGQSIKNEEPQKYRNDGLDEIFRKALKNK